MIYRQGKKVDTLYKGGNKINSIYKNGNKIYSGVFVPQHTNIVTLNQLNLTGDQGELQYIYIASITPGDQRNIILRINGKLNTSYGNVWYAFKVEALGKGAFPGYYIRAEDKEIENTPEIDNYTNYVDMGGEASNPVTIKEFEVTFNTIVNFYVYIIDTYTGVIKLPIVYTARPS